MKSYASKLYFYLLLGYAVYIPIFFNLCGGGWFFLFSCLIFHNVWSNYLSSFFLKKSEEELKEAEERLLEVLDTEISDEQRKELEDALESVQQILKESDSSNSSK